MSAKERFGWIAILDILGFTDLMNRKDKYWIEDDQRIRRALAMVPSIEFYRYEVSFKLVKV